MGRNCLPCNLARIKRQFELKAASQKKGAAPQSNVAIRESVTEILPPRQKKKTKNKPVKTEEIAVEETINEE